MNHLMWNESVARQVGWPSQITASLPIISMARDDTSALGASTVPPSAVAWRL